MPAGTFRYRERPSLMGTLMANNSEASISMLVGFVSLYLLVVMMRVLGLLFRCHRAQLGWLG